MVDTTSDVGKGLLSLYRKYDHLTIGGYMQPQFQVASFKGAESYNGGDFAPRSQSRFMLRRGRIRLEYAHFNDKDQPSVQFVFQFDGTERGVNIRDFWGRVYENKWQLFTFTTGMFARPFGYEVNLSSSDRESPERGRMSQILMRSERDLGLMASFEPRRRGNFWKYVKLDVGAFNGQGLTGPGEYDSYKDLISRFRIKPYPVSKKLSVSAGLSFLQGGFIQNTKYVYNVKDVSGKKEFVVDSSDDNLFDEAPRQYRGADMQWKLTHKWGATELRSEYWWGTQTATALSSETPGLLLTTPYYVRKFNGGFFILLHNIVNSKHQLGVKFDWYDPNTDVKGREIGAPGTHLSIADIRYDTWSFGYNYYITDHLKMFVWYDVVKNESTLLPEYTSNRRPNVFTWRLQFRF
ncbi:porin [Paraflavitalea sp. CAU 1676]|uniref:porin n=1 Tax=Paraflavitalea sp. CAU 1676 TaxID=3032598 RepID=UPI0023DBF391|nr:porin [Paraflavitalea sp. CAU 1676]MDF2187241.1 porin [Paraflavitalea sp. CAU 1676]